MFIIVNVKTGRIMSAPYTYRKNAMKGAARVSAHNPDLYPACDLEVMTPEEYKLRGEELNPMVEVRNMMSGRPVMIRKSEVGTCVDPSTETYWSM